MTATRLPALRLLAAGAVALLTLAAALPSTGAGPEDREPSSEPPPAPSVAYERHPTGQVDVSETITFDASASTSADGGFSDIIWDFGDGYQAEGPVVTHTYETSGVFRVNLTVHGEGGGRAAGGEWIEVVGPDLWPDRQKHVPADGDRWPIETTHDGRTCTIMAAVSLPYDPDDPDRHVGRRFPTVVQFSPYGGNWPGADTEMFKLLRSGYAVVRSSPPGRYRSPDCPDVWDFFGPRDRQAGHDLVEWIADQPWSNGKVGMHGASAPGIEALLTASARPPHLEAVVTNAAYGDPYRDFMYPGGIETTNTFVDAWYHSNLIFPELQDGNAERIVALERSLLAANTHRTYDDYWRDRAIVEHPPPDAPILAYTSNHDIWPRTWMELTRWVTPGGGRVVACPGGHGCVDQTGYTPSWGADGFTNAQGEVRGWWEHHLKGIDNDVDGRPPLTVLSTAGGDQSILTHNAGRWNTFDNYPPDEVVWKDWYLSGESGSNPTLQQLQPETPDGEQPPSPLVASPAAGAASSGASGFVYVRETWGLQEAEEAQALTFETPVFDDPTHVVGPITLRLHATALSPDMGIVARLSDVWPDGQSHYLTEGYLKASHRALDDERTLRNDAGDVIRPYRSHTEAPTEGRLVPGEDYVFEVEVWPVANRFLPGHRLRLQLSAQSVIWHPSAEPGPAALIHHDAERPSRLLLPVLPEDAAPHRFPYERNAR